MDDDFISKDYDCSVLHGTATIQLTRRPSSSDTASEQWDFAGCLNKYHCGIATALIAEGYTFDWYQCPAWRSVNSSGKA